MLFDKLVKEQGINNWIYIWSNFVYHSVFLNTNLFFQALGNETDSEDLKWNIYDIIKTIKDPEKPNNLEVRYRYLMNILNIDLRKSSYC